jgi:superkiller protein 3
VTVLKFYLPSSKFYGLLSTLPAPSPTSPTSSTTFEAQEAIHNGFRVLHEILKLTQAQEEERFEKEVEKRRMRIGAAGPEAVRKEVGLEMFSTSEVGSFFSASRMGPDGGSSFRPCMTLS